MNKYEEFDKQMSKIIMKELEGYTIDHVCSHCQGDGKYKTGDKCIECDGTGTITIEY